MTHAPLFALRALWAHGGAAQAFVARDQRVSEVLARIVRDVVPDLVLRDGDAVQTLAATVGLDRLFGASLASDGRQHGPDARIDEGEARGGRVKHGSHGAGSRGDEVAAGSRGESSGVRADGAWRPGAVEQSAPGEGITRAASRREMAGGHDQGAPGRLVAAPGGPRAQARESELPAAPSSTWARALGDADALSPETSAAQRQLPGQRRQSGHAERAAAQPRLRPPGHAPSTTVLRAVAPLVPTLTDESRRQVAELLARYEHDVAITGRADSGKHPAGQREGELAGGPSPLARVLDTLERRRTGHAALSGQSTRAVPGGRPSGAPDTVHADSPMDAGVETRAVAAAPGAGGFRALASRTLASRTLGLDDAPGVRAPFLQHAAARRLSRPIATESARDVHHLLVAAARTEGLDLDEVTS